MCLRNNFYIVGGKNVFEGDTKTQVWAQKVLPILVRCAQARRTITFSELTEELGLPVRGYTRKMSDVCRHIVKTLAELERRDDWEGEIPHITSIVLRTNGKCSPNMCEALTGNYDTQPSAQQLQTELNCSFCYERWDAVLAALGLPYTQLMSRLN
ncbi:MAG: hypothetical protein OXN27_21530 [Candidatus Poribacteria bacterium]|nr:hypothetical protein [Candidatus Poribacteria bacterium]